MSDDIVLFTGGFDPVHSGHIQTINDARQYGRVVIGLNSDAWLASKKGKPFMPFDERQAIMKELKGVMDVISFDDSDGSASDAIRKVKSLFPSSRVIFVNGGDRTIENIPEMDVFRGDTRVEFKFGVGGSYKKNSSSWLLRDWVTQFERRKWGKSLTYYDGPNSKVKRLVLDLDQSISMQYHNQRSELWFVESGDCAVFSMENGKEVQRRMLHKFETYIVPSGEWHRLQNIGDEKLVIIEIQYGDRCSEDDIVRVTV